MTTRQPPRLRDLSWRDFRELVPAKYDGLIVPIGTVEAHGAIPLGTDIIIPEYLAERLAPRLDLVLAPAVNYGVTRTLLPYPGSHTVTSETFQRYVTEVFVGFGRMGFRRLVVMNGHGGHLDELKAAAQAAFRETNLYTVVLHWWLMAPDLSREVFGAEGYHGAQEETAGVIVAAPDLVKADALRGLKGFAYVPGVYCLPFPRPVSLKVEGEGLPDADYAKASLYMERMEERCYAVITAAFNGWREELAR